MVQVNTPEAEGAQALFCYIADKLGYKEAQKEFAPFYNSKDSKGFFKKYGPICAANLPSIVLYGLKPLGICNFFFIMIYKYIIITKSIVLL